MGGGGNGKEKWKVGPTKKRGSQQQKQSAKKTPPSRKEHTTAAVNDERKEEGEECKAGHIDLSASAKKISPDVQQLLLNVFKYALFSSLESEKDAEDTENGEDKAISTQIQELKTHLYNRDFESAFADASPSLLRAYALRWSASRSLAYCGLYKGVIDCALDSGRGLDDERRDIGVLCIGGGAGAEIVALAGAWRVLQDEQESIKDTDESLPIEGVENLSLVGTSSSRRTKRKLAITAIDIAEWSDVVSRLTAAIHSPHVFGTKTCAAPLVHGSEDESIDISFQKLDILSLSEEGLKALLHRQRVISLMFTLNELFSTSISKTTQLLLRMTDVASPGTILMVVDSPGSYSTLSFGKNESPEKQQEQQRQYPMKFLLDHTLLSVAEGSWEKLISQDSRWFRKDAHHKLHYNVDLEGGQGFIRLEDMRFQIHVYRRLSSPTTNE